MLIKINKNLLKNSLVRAGVSDKVEVNNAINQFKEYVIKNFGKQTLIYINPQYIKNNQLVIKINNSLIAQELKQKESEILDFINQQTSNHLKRLRFIT